jgi:hypothetical protein
MLQQRGSDSRRRMAHAFNSKTGHGRCWGKLQELRCISLRGAATKSSEITSITRHQQPAVNSAPAQVHQLQVSPATVCNRRASVLPPAREHPRPGGSCCIGWPLTRPHLLLQTLGNSARPSPVGMSLCTE